MKQIKKRVQTLLLLGSLIPFGANAQNEKLTEKEIENNVVRNFYADCRQNIESNRLEYVIPDSYYKAYTENLGYNLDVFEKVRSLRSHFLNEYTPDPTPEVPEQFKFQKVISGTEQERIIEEEAAEKLYKEQSDPMYFQNSKASFQEEFNLRMQQKSLKK